MPEPPRRKQWYRPRNVLLAIVFVIVLVVAWVFLDLWRVYTDTPESPDEYREQMIALCADGQPEGQDGWPLLASVLHQLDSAAEEARRGLRESGNRDRVDDAGRAAMEGALDDLDLLNELRKALAMPRFVRPWALEGFLINELLPLISPARDLGEILSRRMREAAERGDWTEATDLMRLAIQLGRRNGPTADQHPRHSRRIHPTAGPPGCARDLH